MRYVKAVSPLYEKMGRGEVAGRGSQASTARSGRKRKPVDELMLREAVERYRNHQWTAREAATYLDISEPTFYRRMKEKEGSKGY